MEDKEKETNKKEYPLKTEILLEPKEIVQRISDYGVVGLGGATFPSHVKLNVKEGVKLENQVLITEDGVENMTKFPFAENLIS